jgi:Domain of unknown function (DUF1772)
MKKIVLFLSITFAAGLLMTNVYNSLIDAKSWGTNIPDSIQIARNYFQHVNPGNFYRVFSPLTQVLALITLVVFWKRSKSLRIFFGIAFFLFVMTDVLTFAYFYPRNDILFMSSLTGNTEKIKTAWAQWSEMNWVRSLIGAGGLFFSFRGLDIVNRPTT